MTEQNIHIFEQMVRFEDIDWGGIVYHPVYLNYLERARSQSLIEKNASFRRFIEEGFGFVVSSVQMKYIRPLRLEDTFFVGTQVDDSKQHVIHMTQAICRTPKDFAKTGHLKDELTQMETLCFYAHLKLCVISLADGRPTMPPDWITALL